MRNQISYRIVNLIVSLFVATIDSLRSLFARLTGRPRRKTCVVFLYHSVHREQRARFAHQLDVILRHAQPVSADIAVLPDENRRYAAITFDDGVENVSRMPCPNCGNGTFRPLYLWSATCWVVVPVGNFAGQIVLCRKRRCQKST